MKLLITPSTAFVVLVANCLASLSFADSKQLKSVGMTVGDLANPFFVKVARTAEVKAKEYNPNVKFTSLSGSYDVNNQTNQIDNFVSSGVDLILLAPVDSKGIAPAVARAKAAGVVVIAVGDRAEGGVDATVLSDHVQAGQLDGKYIAQHLNGKGQIVIVNGPPVSAVFERVKGALDVLSAYPEIKILSQDQNANGSRDGGLRVMTDLLTAFPKIDAVFAINDPTGIGCDLAAKQAQRREFFIVGVDGSPDAAALLKSKEGLFVATCSQDADAIAQRSVEVGCDILNGKKPESAEILIPGKMITRDNVNEYKGWGD
jgi:ribose transport system substrate-binding protein